MKETYFPKSQGSKRRPDRYLPVNHGQAPHSCRQSHSHAHPYNHRCVFRFPQTLAGQEPAVSSFPLNCHCLVERQFWVDCKQRRGLSLFYTIFFSRTLGKRRALKIRGPRYCFPVEQRAGLFSVQCNKSAIFLWGHGKARSLPIIEESDTPSSESLSWNTTHCLRKVPWPSLCSAVASCTNAGGLATTIAQAPLKLWQANLLAYKKDKISDSSWFLTPLSLMRKVFVWQKWDSMWLNNIYISSHSVAKIMNSQKITH